MDLGGKRRVDPWPIDSLGGWCRGGGKVGD